MLVRSFRHQTWATVKRSHFNHKISPLLKRRLELMLYHYPIVGSFDSHRTLRITQVAISAKAVHKEGWLSLVIEIGQQLVVPDE